MRICLPLISYLIYWQSFYLQYWCYFFHNWMKNIKPFYFFNLGVWILGFTFFWFIYGRHSIWIVRMEWNYKKRLVFCSMVGFCCGLVYIRNKNLTWKSYKKVTKLKKIPLKPFLYKGLKLGYYWVGIDVIAEFGYVINVWKCFIYLQEFY